MEFKVIVYIIIGIVYFIISLNKKRQEKDKAPKAEAPAAPKPVSPPNPIEDLLREFKAKQAQAEAAKAKQMPVQQPKMVKTTPAKDLLVREKNKGFGGEGNYERALTDEEKIVRGNIKIENEGIYKIKTADEMQAEEEASGFTLNLRDAVVGSLILERKF